MEDKIFFNDDWIYFDEFDESEVEMKLPSKKNSFGGQSVRLPHTFCLLPFNNFSEKLYQKVGLYRKEFKTLPEWAGKKILLTVEGAAHESTVYLNGQPVYQHKCGYTAFTVDLTKKLNAKEKNNVLAIKVNSKENLNIPPFGNVVDYLTYGGIYRDVYLEIKNEIYIEDVFVTTKKNRYTSQITLNTNEGIQGYSIHQSLYLAQEENPFEEKKSPEKSAGKKVSKKGKKSFEEEGLTEVNQGVATGKILTSAQVVPCMSWSLESPVLYYLKTELLDEKGKVCDTKIVRFGFRDIRFDESGFYLNNKKIKLRGLNRHQSFPYVGYAMPKNMQRDDADILKYQLGLNEVRTSHYPQSQHFIDRCDEIGLLVFTEIPGWQYIGDDEWKAQAVKNTEDMVKQYRNHPSIFMWGVRINESLDDDNLYAKTNYACHSLDPSRPTSGVRYLQNSHLLEDVYSYNDFSHTGNNAGLLHKENVTKTKKGYMVSEYNGHMYPTKTFDNEEIRTNHALRHANVLEAAAEYDEIAGTSGWCAFDYNTHRDFGSGDRICYHGVMDMFRNPKIASYVYSSQEGAEVVGDVLEVNSSMDKGEYPGGTCGYAWIFTNADSVKLFINNEFIREYTKNDSPYKHLAHGPIPLFDTIGNQLVEKEGVKAKYSDQIKEILQALRFYTVENLPKKLKRLALKLNFLKVINLEKMTAWYGKYIGNWGGKVNTWKLEAYRRGQLVKTVTRVPNKKFFVEASTKRNVLLEENSYDVSEVHLTAKDEHGNILPYCQEAVKVKVQGPLELIGPDCISLKGGMAGTFVKSMGVPGKGSLVIDDWYGNETILDFTVKVLKK